MNMKRKGLIFDLDGTLWDSSKEVADSWNAVIEDLPDVTEKVTPEKIRSLMGKPMNEIARTIFHEVSEEKALEYMEECGEYENAYLYEHGAKPVEQLRETLQQLHREFIICIASNCQQGYIETFLQKYQLQYIVDDWIDYGTTHKTKAENIKAIMERNDMLWAAYIGDTDGDHQSAKKAEIPFVFASYGFGETEGGDYRISSLPELFQLDFVTIKPEETTEE